MSKENRINEQTLAELIREYHGEVIGEYENTLDDDLAILYEWCDQLKLITLYRLCGVEAFNLTSARGRRLATRFSEKSDAELDTAECTLCRKLFRKLRWLNGKCQQLLGAPLLLGWITEEDSYDLADEWVMLDSRIRKSMSLSA